MGKLDGKVALVTGASKGIGAGVALSLAKEGAAVALNYFSDRQAADRVVEKIKAADGKAIAVQGSVTSSEEIDRFFNQTEKQLGNVDVLVNNAGVFAYLALQDVNEKEFHRQFNTNVLGLLLTSKRAVKQFGEKGGCIINIGSVASTLTPPASSIYAATKSAVDGITRVLAKELGPRNIRVNSINPGVVDTEGARAMETYEEVAKRDQGADFARSNRHTGGHRVDRSISRLRRSPMAQRRDHLRQRRSPLNMNEVVEVSLSGGRQEASSS
jgi:3-oxoacyl-[acyl-carrier protein] reductase